METKTAKPFLISIDPGVYSCAVVAWIGSTDDLVAPGVHIFRGALTTPCRAQQTPLAVLDLIEAWGFVGVPVVIEFPVKYPTRRSTHSDIARMLDVIAAIEKAYAPGLVDHVSPFGWKGNTPKGIQASRILSALTKEEHEAVTWPKKSLRHNVIDAIGIGLWKLCRLGRGSV